MGMPTATMARACVSVAARLIAWTPLWLFPSPYIPMPAVITTRYVEEDRVLVGVSLMVTAQVQLCAQSRKAASLDVASYRPANVCLPGHLPWCSLM